MLKVLNLFVLPALFWLLAASVALHGWAWVVVPAFGVAYLTYTQTVIGILVLSFLQSVAANNYYVLSAFFVQQEISEVERDSAQLGIWLGRLLALGGSLITFAVLGVII